MKKINSLVLSTLTAVLLVGCGGGSSSTSPTPSTTSVPVTKGPLLEAVAKDKAGKTGTQIAGTNKYEFSGEVTYPITVTGGYVDVNNNGIVDAGDYAFNGKLSSYSNVVTPITTYLGDTSKDEGKAKLVKLKELTGATDDDLLTKDPVDTNENVLTLVASIYQTYSALMDNDNTNDGITDDIGDDNSALSNKFDEYKQVISSGTNTNETLEDKLVRIEEHLRDNSDVEKLSEFDAEKVNFSKNNLLGKKLIVNNETYYFRKNDIVLGDSGEDYTQLLSYGSIENGIIKLEFENGNYDLITLTETGFDISYYENEVLSESFSITNKLIDYSQSDLVNALADVPFEFTLDMISGKKIIISDNIGEYEGQFKSDGSYSETWDDSKSQGNSGTCTGTWAVNSQKTGIEIASTCSDNNTLETYSLIFSELPVSGSEIKIIVSGEPDNFATITDIDLIDENSTGTNSTISIENNFGTDSLKNQTLYSVWYGEEEDHKGDTATAASLPIIQKQVIGNNGSVNVVGLLNSQVNVNGYLGIKDNKLFMSETTSFDETIYNEYDSGNLSSGCIKTNYVNTQYPDNNNTDFVFSDFNVAIGFASIIDDSTVNCPTSSSDYISIENDFGDDSFKNRTFYVVYYGLGEDSNGNEIDNVAVVDKFEIDSYGNSTITGLKNSYGTFSGVLSGIHNNKLYARIADSYDKFESDYNEYISGSISEGCIKTNYYENGVLDNVDLFFTDETEAMNFANTLTSSITSCPN